MEDERKTAETAESAPRQADEDAKASFSAPEEETAAESDAPHGNVRRAGRVYTPENPEGIAYGAEPAEEENARREGNGRGTERRRRAARTWTGAALAVFLILCSFGAGIGGAALYARLRGTGTVESPRAVLYQSVIRSVNGETDKDGALTVNEVADVASPSVVEIVTESVSYNTFFGQVPVSGAGSGVILTEDGLIVTNYHVVEGANQVTVTLKSGESYPARIVGEDDESDLALLRIDVSNLTAAVLGSSDSLRVGDGVVAIGNPLGELGGTVTDGIVSALDREIEIDGKTYRLLQTNAAINAGNSGGGLFNMNGELVGIVNAKVTQSGVEGLGFAIPMDHAKSIIEEISAYGYIRGRIDLGVDLIEINDAVTARYYNVTEGGVYVSSVTDSGTGLRAGDMILTADGKEILTMKDFEKVLAEHRAGDTLSLTVKRRVSRVNYEESAISFVLKEKIPEDLKR